jgi:hypothetical protein
VTDKHDRRPWLILSRREAIALELAVLDAMSRGLQPDEELERAMRMVRQQLLYIDSGHGNAPQAAAAVRREQR